MHHSDARVISMPDSSNALERNEVRAEKESRLALMRTSMSQAREQEDFLSFRIRTEETKLFDFLLRIERN